ncbi:MAG: capsular polysaccharide synthesis protein [Alistipes sp.]|jgi:hypothetical protein|nr:capsular polysaccharide synthesis protein [Alistipes sp.]
MTLEQFAARAATVIKGRIPFWIQTERRREMRYDVVSRYFERFLPAVAGVSDTPATQGASGSPGVDVAPDDGKEKIFSIWLQGEESAPPLVSACMRSIRRHCVDQQLVVLDEHSLFDHIDLPGWIMDKYARGNIRRAHFADIARVELLHNYGGVWLDATCFVTAPIPKFMIDEDFFVYRAGCIRAASHIQNCFIRARKGTYLLEAWRAMIHEYWRQEPDAIDYFMHQLLFKKLVQNDPRAIAAFAAMPQIDQDPTHALWWSSGSEPFDRDLFDRLTANSFFQKTSHRSEWGKIPPPGSFADEMINRM